MSIPSSVSDIGDGAFTDTGWYNNQDDGILYLDKWLVGYKGNKPTNGINIHEGIKGVTGLANCTELTSIAIPSSVSFIGSDAFMGCTKLLTVFIPTSIKSIGKIAFSDCTSLTNVYCLSETVPSISSDAFDYVPLDDATLYVPKKSIEAYRNVVPWKMFGNIIGIAHISDGDFNGDGNVDTTDLNLMVKAVLENMSAESNNEKFDINGDGLLNVEDIVMYVKMIKLKESLRQILRA